MIQHWGLYSHNLYMIRACFCDDFYLNRQLIAFFDKNLRKTQLTDNLAINK